MRPELLGFLKLCLPKNIIKITQPTLRQQPAVWLLADRYATHIISKLFRYHSLFYKTQAIDTNGYEIQQTKAPHHNTTALINIFTLPNWGLKLLLTTRIHTHQMAPTLSTQFSGLAWGEREISEMLGINYKNKIDARRLMLDYAFEGHPLRKNFPTVGFEEIEYNALDRWLNYTKIMIRDDTNF